MRILSWLGVLAVGLVATGGCAAGGAARAARPQPSTAAAALDENGCREAGREAAPLIVDWPTNQRAELETALLRGGLLLVEYACGSVRIVSGCRAGGDYRYEPVTLKEDMVRMSDADSVRAKLPTLGAALPLDLNAELARGRTLELALAVVGQYTAQQPNLFSKNLSSLCRRATHVVTAVPVGAFAMSVGSEGRARAAAELFAGGVDSDSTSSKIHASKDGNLASCRAAIANDATAPPGCRGPLRLGLTPIDQRSTDRAGCEDRDDSSKCFKWSEEVFGQTVDPEQALPLLRKLETLCRDRDAASCELAWDLAGKKEAPKVDTRALAERGCALGRGVMCTYLALALQDEGREEEALAAKDFACRAEPGLCGPYGDAIEGGQQSSDVKNRRLADVRARECLGSSQGCDKYAVLYRSGVRASGSFVEMKKAIATCTRQPAGTCYFAAAAYAFGLGVSRDLPRAKAMWSKQACVTQPDPKAPLCPFPKLWE